jgi:hypothetical protein
VPKGVPGFAVEFVSGNLGVCDRRELCLKWEMPDYIGISYLVVILSYLNSKIPSRNSRSCFLSLYTVLEASSHLQ